MRTPTIGDLLNERMQYPVPLVSQIKGTVLFAPRDGEPWTLELHHGHTAVKHGRPKKPTTTIVSDMATMTGVIMGKQSGIEAFLEGHLTVRGNLALSLKLDSLFAVPHRPKHFAQANFVHAADIRTFYLDAGEGDPVVLLHGLGATNASMLPTMSALSRHYRVIAPDNPGFGETDKPLAAYHPAFFARWAKNLLDELGIPKAHFIGNSMGGRIALEMAMRYPDRVNRLVLFAPSVAWHKFRQFVPIVRFLLPELAFTPLIVPRSRVMAGLKLMFSKPERLQQAWYDAAVDEFLRVFSTPRGRVAFFSAAKQIYMEESHGERGFWNRLPSIEHEALFIWGKRDRLVPASFGRHVSHALPHARSHTFTDCGHVPQFELPDETHQLVLDFLRERS